MAKKHPPHLPKKTSSSAMPKTTLTLGWLAVFLIMSILVSITAVFYVGSWIFGETALQQPLFPQLSRQVSSLEDPLLAHEQKEVQDRIVRVYETTPEATVLQANNQVGVGTWITTDGWFVFDAPQADLVTSSLIVVDNTGVSYTIDRLIADPTYAIMYAKASQANVRFSNAVYSWRNIDDTTLVTVVGSQGMQTHQLIETMDDDTDIAAWALRDEATNGPLFIGGPVYLGQITNNQLVPNWYITRQLARIFSQVPVTNISLPFTAEYVHYTRLTGDDWKQVTGLMVQQAPASSELQVGDLITKINGRTVLPGYVLYDWYSSSDMNALTLQRDNQVRTITVPQQLP